MAQIITDLSKIEALTPFEGVPVVATGIEVPGLSGGLNDALRVDPIEKHKDEDVVLVVKGTVAKVRFDPVKGHEDAWQRVHILKVAEVALIDEDVVAEALEDQRRRIDNARRRAEEGTDTHQIRFPAPKCSEHVRLQSGRRRVSPSRCPPRHRPWR